MIIKRYNFAPNPCVCYEGNCDCKMEENKKGEYVKWKDMIVWVKRIISFLIGIGLVQIIYQLSKN